MRVSGLCLRVDSPQAGAGIYRPKRTLDQAKWIRASGQQIDFDFRNSSVDPIAAAVRSTVSEPVSAPSGRVVDKLYTTSSLRLADATTLINQQLSVRRCGKNFLLRV